MFNQGITKFSLGASSSVYFLHIIEFNQFPLYAHMRMERVFTPFVSHIFYWIAIYFLFFYWIGNFIIIIEWKTRAVYFGVCVCVDSSFVCLNLKFIVYRIHISISLWNKNNLHSNSNKEGEKQNCFGFIFNSVHSASNSISWFEVLLLLRLSSFHSNINAFIIWKIWIFNRKLIHHDIRLLN